MTATIERLKTKPQTDQEATRGRLILALEQIAYHRRGRAADLARELQKELRRDAAATDPEWTFVMIGPRQFNFVRRCLLKGSANPNLAVNLWCEMMEHLDPKTGEILASRTQLAALVGTHPDEISRMIGELARIGAIIRERKPANGRVRYYLNPLVGTCLPEAPRKAAQRKAPELRVIQPA